VQNYTSSFSEILLGLLEKTKIIKGWW